MANVVVRGGDSPVLLSTNSSARPDPGRGTDYLVVHSGGPDQAISPSFGFIASVEHAQRLLGLDDLRTDAVRST